MKKIIFILFLASSLFSQWKMFHGEGNVFLYNSESGEVFRHYQILSGNGDFLKEEGFMRVKFTTFTKYPMGSQMVSPTGTNPKEMKTMENKLIDRLAK